MTFRLLDTKFHIPPRREELVARPRLTAELQRGATQGHKLILVSAPAGYGKTTVVAGWLAELEAAGAGERPAVAWLSLDEADDEPGRFLRYFLAALQRAGAPVDEATLSLLALPQRPPLPTLLDGLLNGLPAMIIVLDDYQTIASATIHEALAYFVDHQPAGTCLALITRQDPPLPLSRLRARGQMTELRARDLRFTPDEAAQFFKQTTRLEPASEAARTLEERTEGWAAGLQLAGLALRNAPDPERFIRGFRGSHRYVFDYLAEEVIAQQDEAVRAFLARTAVLDRFNASLGQAVAGYSVGQLDGQPDTQAMIERLERANLFVIPLDDERVWYRYHHLFRDYLATLLDAPERAALYRKAATWHEAHGTAAEAVGYALAGGDAAFAADVVERATGGSAVWSGGNVALLTSWLEALPAETLRSRPQLLLSASRVYYLASRFDLAERRLGEAEEALAGLAATPEAAQLSALAALYRGSLAAVYGDFQQAAEQTRLALAGLPEESRLARARAGFNLGQAYEAADQPDAAVEHYLRASDEARAAGVEFLAIQARCAAAQTLIRRGDLDRAEALCRQAIEPAGDERIPPLGLAGIVLGAIALERGDLRAAEALLQDGVALSRQGGLLDNVVTGLALQARLRAALGDGPGAVAAARDGLAITRAFGVPAMTARAAAALARAQLAAGETAAAQQWAASYRAGRDAAATDYEDLTLAQVLLAMNQPEAVPALARPALERATAAGWQDVRTEALRLLDLAQRPRDIPANARLPEPLSEQELRVLGLIMAGNSNREIAAELVISVGTAKWHVHNILQKLGASNRPQAIARARELGF